MKKILIIAVSGLLFSCGMSKEEKLIADHEQTLGDSKVDLKFDPIETKEIKIITASDSSKMLQDFYDSAFSVHLKNGMDRIEEMKKNIIASEKDIAETAPSIRYLFQEGLDDDKESLKRMEESYETAKLNPDDLFQDEWLDKKKSFETLGSEVIGHILECRYKIFNPMLQVEQEITRQYLFDKDKTKIIRTL